MLHSSGENNWHFKYIGGSMDAFGIGAAVKGMLMIYSRSGRKTGRTTALINSLKDGDRVIFSDKREANRFERLCRDRGLYVCCIVIEPREPQRVMALGRVTDCRTVFDHSWVEEFYLHKVKEAVEEVDHWQNMASGFKSPPIETRECRLEVMKWEP
jgi:hypothetical protein